MNASRQQTYRQWAQEGARGFFLTPGVAVNPVRLINPLDRRGGFFVRRDVSDPLQQARRAQLALGERDDGEREDRRMLARERASLGEGQGEGQGEGHTHVLACDREPVPDSQDEARTESGDSRADGEAAPQRESERVSWIVTARVEQAAEVVRRGWLRWETLGEVVLPATAGGQKKEGREASPPGAVREARQECEECEG